MLLEQEEPMLRALKLFMFERSATPVHIINQAVNIFPLSMAFVLRFRRGEKKVCIHILGECEEVLVRGCSLQLEWYVDLGDFRNI